MFEMTRLKTIGLCAVSLLVFSGLIACSEQADIIPSAPLSEAAAAKISPPDVLLQGGKDHFNKRLPEIAAQPLLKGGLLLAGDSITEAWLWHEDYLPLPSSNHGIGWDIAEGLKLRLPLILQHDPDHLFILIGTNDIGYGHGAEDVVPHVEAFIETLQKEKPKTKLYLQAVLPREATSMPKVREYNAAYKALAMKHDVAFIDMTHEFAAGDGTLNSDYTEDALHLNAAGYELWGRLMADNLIR